MRLGHAGEGGVEIPPAAAAAQGVDAIASSANDPDAVVPVLKKAIALNEHSAIADLCREARIEIVRRNLKAAVPRGLRTEVVVFCLAALETFKEVGRERTETVTFEIASLGSGGLNIKDHSSRFRLMSLAGKFSALQLVVYMWVGLKRVDPKTDPGIDFSKEYAFALSMLRGKKKRFKGKKSR